MPIESSQIDTMLESLQQKIDYKAKDVSWLRMAVTHSSFKKKNPQLVDGDYERLEFVGDAVLDLVVANMLFDQFPQDDEGHLSRKRASLVCEESLFNIAMRLQLDECLLIDEGEERQGLRTNKRLLSSALEGLIGAIYKDAGTEKAYAWVENLFHTQIDHEFSEHDFVKDYKTRFQELIQEKLKITPVYKMSDVFGPDHQKMFCVQVLVNDVVYGEGTGESKKVAAQMAAEQALKRCENGI
jgi:ribonuclease III